MVGAIPTVQLIKPFPDLVLLPFPVIVVPAANLRSLKSLTFFSFYEGNQSLNQALNFLIVTILFIVENEENILDDFSLKKTLK